MKKSLLALSIPFLISSCYASYSESTVPVFDTKPLPLIKYSTSGSVTALAPEAPEIPDVRGSSEHIDFSKITFEEAYGPIASVSASATKGTIVHVDFKAVLKATTISQIKDVTKKAIEKHEKSEELQKEIEKASAEGKFGFFYKIFGFSTGGKYEKDEESSSQRTYEFSDTWSREVTKDIMSLSESLVEVSGSIDVTGVLVSIPSWGRVLLQSLTISGQSNESLTVLAADGPADPATGEFSVSPIVVDQNGRSMPSKGPIKIKPLPIITG